MGARAHVYCGTDQTERPIQLGRKDRTGWPTARLSTEQRDAAAHVFRFRANPIRSLQCRAQHLTRLEVVHVDPNSVVLTLVHEILESKLGRVHPQLSGQEIGVALCGKDELMCAGRAE